MARSKFKSEKRQKELARKKKKEEKIKRKLENKTGAPEESPDPEDAGEGIEGPVPEEDPPA